MRFCCIFLFWSLSIFQLLFLFSSPLFCSLFSINFFGSLALFLSRSRYSVTLSYISILQLPIHLSPTSSVQVYIGRMIKIGTHPQPFFLQLTFKFELFWWPRSRGPYLFYQIITRRLDLRDFKSFFFSHISMN